MTTYEPGTVAVATVRGVKGVRVMAGYGTAEPRLRWLTTDGRLVDERNDGWYFAFDVTDIRPLVVLDLDSELMQRFMRYGHEMCSVSRDLRDQIEAQTKPPRIPEPGLWGVVEAKHPDSGRLRLRFVRVDDSYPQRWQPVCMNYSEPLTWGDLIDPTLVREGLS